MEPAWLVKGVGIAKYVFFQSGISLWFVAGTLLLAAASGVVVFQKVRRSSVMDFALLRNVNFLVLVLFSVLLIGEMLHWTPPQRLGCVIAACAVATYSMLQLFAKEEGNNGSQGNSGSGGVGKLQVPIISLGFFVAVAYTLLVSAREGGIFGGDPLVDWSSWVDRRTMSSKGSNVDPCQGTRVDKEKGQPRRATQGELMLVTGGSGFIGSHLVSLLLHLGYRVRVFDNFETGNLMFLDLRHPHLDIMFGDILDLEALHRAMVGVRGVFHLAAASKVLPSLRDPSMATFNFERNAVGTGRVLEAANASNTVQKVVYAASSTYYGNQLVPFRETDPFIPTSPYAASKYMGELAMATHDNVYHLPTLSLRFFMVYGPRNPAHGAYAIVTGKFIARLREGKPLLIEGSGKNFRDFVHVEDVARALVLGLQSDVHGTVVNVGSGRAFSIKDVADLVSEQQEHVHARPNDLLGTLADTCRAKQHLHFEARHNFVETMKRMITEAQAGKSEYLAPIWENPRVVAALERRLAGWSGVATLHERNSRLRNALVADPAFLQSLLREINDAWPQPDGAN